MNKLNKLTQPYNLVSRVKRVKDFFIHQLQGIDHKVNELHQKLDEINAHRVKLDAHQTKLDTLQATLDELKPYINPSCDAPHQDRLWPWSYLPPAMPAVLPSGRPWPKISIVTPSYNHGEYLEETIRSVLLQGYPNLEYILVDGGSTDYTGKILSRYQAELTVCISEPDDGQAHAINKGFQQATGQILAWLNSDDLYLPGTLALVAQAFDQHQVDVVVGDCQTINDFNHHPSSTHRSSLPVNEVTRLPYEAMLDFGGAWLEGNFFFQPETFWTRQAWELAGGSINENLNFGIDYDFWLRLARKKATALQINAPLAIFRIHGAQKTTFSQNLDDYPEYMAISKYYQELDSVTVPDRSRILVEVPKTDGSGHETLDISGTLPEEPFASRKLVPYTTPLGKFYLPFDGTRGDIARKIRAGRVYAPELKEVAEKLIQPKTAVIDVGTNLGQTAVLFAGLTGSEGQVLAFESDAYLFQALHKTLAANFLYHVRPYLRLVSNRSNQLWDASHDVSQDIYTLALDDLDIAHSISLMKVSASGQELVVLQGALKTILKYRMPIIVEHHPQVTSTTFQQLNDFVESLGYRVDRTLDSIFYLLLPDPDKPTTISLPSHEPLDSIAHPRLETTHLCKFLKSRSEVDECTTFLHRNGFASHNLICKDWDIAHIISEIGDGNFLDMGSSDSYILKNLALKRIQGQMYGIDFQEPDVPVTGVTYLKGDLMNTPLPSAFFQNISCLSVIEHEVDFVRFAQETSRLLKQNGRLFVTFDYWEPKIVSPVRLYDLAWQPLDKAKVLEFTTACNQQGLELVQTIDWNLGDPVIQYGYYAPHPSMKYTFGLLVFEKS